MEHRGRPVKNTAGIANAGPAGGEDRPNKRDPHLAPMRMPGQHQIKLMLPGPSELIRAMGEQNADRSPFSCWWRGMA